MILISGGISDIVVKYVCAMLEKKGYDYFLFNEDEYPKSYNLTWNLTNGIVNGKVYHKSKQINLESIGSVYVRHSDAIQNESSKENISRIEYYFSLNSLLNLIPAFVVNRPKYSASNSSKPYQQQILTKHGFKTPDTLITNNPEDAHNFYKTHDDKIIYKSISGVRSIVNLVSPNDIDRFNNLKNCPTQFQEFVDGDDIRVHTVGDQLLQHEYVPRQ